jgi:transpeptidase family protein/penicillin-binding protein
VSATSSPSEAPRPSRLSPARRHKLAWRLLPLVAIATLAFGTGLLLGARHEPRERTIAERYLTAWERDEVGGMYSLLAASSRRAYSVDDFRGLFADAATTATLEGVRQTGPLQQTDNDFEVPMEAQTRLFGPVDGTLSFRVVTDADDTSGVVFEPRLVFPGLDDGEELKRTTELPGRGDLQARDGTVLASGPDRASDVLIAPEIVGSMGPIPEDRRAEYESLGYPNDATVGLTGLELQFEQRLAGTLGGKLRAGERTLAEVEPQPGSPVRTSIDVDLEEAAVTALAGRLGGIAVLRPRTGEVLALAGLGYSTPQPPGSTFKIITLAGALDAGTVKRSDEFPVQTEAVLEGVSLKNANGESCGGTLEESFAHSCNSVFAPMGAELGAERLVATAERFGFNDEDGIQDAPPGAIPPASEIGDDLAVGATAIGQGRVTSTPLRMAEVAGVIANDGTLVRPVFSKGEQGRSSQATSKHTAKIITAFMRSVVDYGTGTAADIEGEDIAGKTGTAELENTDPEATTSDPENTDAWFVAFAPAKKPKVVVAVMLVRAGAGGATAAPAARIVLDAAL